MIATQVGACMLYHPLLILAVVLALGQVHSESAYVGASADEESTR